jgi:hypothetical protein
MSVQEAIRYASSLLPGRSAPEGEPDPRWQAIIDLAEFIATDPEEVWSFVARWAVDPNADVRSAVATCLLEHLLEHHFALFFPRVEHLAQQNEMFADTFLRCAKFGQSEDPTNAGYFDKLRDSLRSRSSRGQHGRK